jgi:hypothetical protein
MTAWVASLIVVVGLGAFTIYRLVRSWRSARGRLKPPGPGSVV